MTAMDLALKGGFARGPGLEWPFVYRTMRAAHEYSLQAGTALGLANSGIPAVC